MAELTQDERPYKYIVRLYDGSDNKWMNISKTVPYAEAKTIWDKHTQNGTKNTKFADIDYYRIFPADTKMLYQDR